MLNILDKLFEQALIAVTVVICTGFFGALLGTYLASLNLIGA